LTALPAAVRVRASVAMARDNSVRGSVQGAKVDLAEALPADLC
jgi:hypothetical protein